MPELYSLLTGLLALTGCISIVMTRETNLLVAAGALALLLPGYYRLLTGRGPAGKRAIGLFSFLSLLFFLFDGMALSGDFFVAVAHLTMLIQAIKSFDLKEPWDFLQVYFVSLLQLVIASELSSSIVFGAVFLVFMLMLVAAMVLSHFLKEGHHELKWMKKPFLVIVALVAFTTACFFIALPRASFRMIGKSHAHGILTTGFSNTMDFGSFGKVKLDPAIIMRVEFDKAPPPPWYWRGMTLDTFDGLRWTKNAGAALTRRHRDAGREDYVLARCGKMNLVEQRIYLEPVDSDVLFALQKVCSVRTMFYGLQTDRSGGIRQPGKSGRMARYSVSSELSPGQEEPSDEAYLQLPPGIDRVAALARSVGGQGKSAEQKALLIERYLRKNFTYALESSEPARGVSPIDHFLFHSKRGYCEHYSTAMVLMLRSLGIPARVVNGFLGGESNEYGGYFIVRKSDAHAWVEAYTGNSEWKRFDPTPSVETLQRSPMGLFLDTLSMTWRRYVVGFSTSDQKSMARMVTLSFSLPHSYGFQKMQLKRVPWEVLLTAAAAVALLLAARRVRSNRSAGFATQKYLACRKLLRKKGIVVLPGMTAGDLREAVRQRSWKSAEEFLAAYEEHRFGKRPMTPEDKRRYKELLRDIKRET